MGNNNSATIPKTQLNLEDPQIKTEEFTWLYKNTFITGLYTFDIYYSKKYNKVIYLLGEAHNKKGCDEESLKQEFPRSTTMKATDFFFNILDKGKNNYNELNPIHLDVFLETDYNPKEQNLKYQGLQIEKGKEFDSGQGYLGDTLIRLSKFYDCGINYEFLKKEIESCSKSFPDVRFHSADVRGTTNDVLQYLGSLLQYINYCFIYDQNTENCEEHYNNIIKYQKNREITILEKDLEEALEDTKIMEQLNNIPEKYQAVKNYLLENHKKMLQKYLPQLTYDKIIKILQKYKVSEGGKINIMYDFDINTDTDTFAQDNLNYRRHLIDKLKDENSNYSKIVLKVKEDLDKQNKLEKKQLDISFLYKTLKNSDINNRDDKIGILRFLQGEIDYYNAILPNSENKQEVELKNMIKLGKNNYEFYNQIIIQLISDKNQYNDDKQIRKELILFKNDIESLNKEQDKIYLYDGPIEYIDVINIFTDALKSKKINLDSIINSLKSIQEGYLEMLNENLDKYNNYKDTKDKYIMIELFNQIKNTTYLYSSIMDMYLVSRIFRTFRQIQGKYSEEPKNIIIYAGDWHVNQYKEMFENLGFEKVYGAKKIGNNCVDVSDFKQYIWIK